MKVGGRDAVMVHRVMERRKNPVAVELAGQRLVQNHAPGLQSFAFIFQLATGVRNVVRASHERVKRAERVAFRGRKKNKAVVKITRRSPREIATVLIGL